MCAAPWPRRKRRGHSRAGLGAPGLRARIRPAASAPPRLPTAPSTPASARAGAPLRRFHPRLFPARRRLEHLLLCRPRLFCRRTNRGWATNLTSSLCHWMRRLPQLRSARRRVVQSPTQMLHRRPNPSRSPNPSQSNWPRRRLRRSPRLPTGALPRRCRIGLRSTSITSHARPPAPIRSPRPLPLALRFQRQHRPRLSPVPPRRPAGEHSCSSSMCAQGHARPRRACPPQWCAPWLRRRHGLLRRDWCASKRTRRLRRMMTVMMAKESQWGRRCWPRRRPSPLRPRQPRNEPPGLRRGRT